MFSALSMAQTARGIEPCDFDGPGGGFRTDEIGYYVPQTGNWSLRSLTGGVVTASTNWGWSDAVPVVGDYDGDGFADLGVYYREQGLWFIKSFNSNTLLAYAEEWGDRNMIPVPEDYDGDGQTDLAVYERSTGRWFIKTLGDNRLLAFALNWGTIDTVPVPGDYDGDGAADIGIYHRKSGSWFVRGLTGGVIVAGANWGGPNMWPVPGDYDGDGKHDLGVYERTTGNWFIKRHDDPGPALVFGRNWGAKQLMPVPGDYNGDGKMDLGVYYRALGMWFISTVAETQTLAFATVFGNSNSVPIQSYIQRASDGVNMLCFGDSITYGQGSSSDGPDTGYPVLLEKKLDVFVGGTYFAINAGKPGESTRKGRERLPGVLDQYDPDIMMLMEGTNDARYDDMFQITEPNLRAMVDMALSRGIRCVIATIPPVIKSAYRDRTEQNNRIKAFNPRIYDIASDKGIPLAKVYEAITSQPNWQSTLMDQVTANHPNDAGYRFVRDAFYEAVRSLILSGNIY